MCMWRHDSSLEHIDRAERLCVCGDMTQALSTLIELRDCVPVVT